MDDVLGGIGSWDPEVDSVVLAEGLLMYLPPSAVRTLFAEVQAHAGARSRVAFSFVGMRDGGPDAGPASPLTLWSLRVAGEPWLWAIDPPLLDDFLGAIGWRRLPAMDGVCRAGIEHLAVATLARDRHRADDGGA